MRVTMRVDGDEVAADIDRPGESLLSTLRDRLGRTGTKNACEQGECGSCTVLLDGAPVCACLVATAQCQGREVRTVASVPTVLRDAFVACGAVQCGFCTPGLLVSAADLLGREPDPGEEAIREAIAGNLCRCTGYEKVVEAVRAAAEATADGVPRVPARSHLHHNQWINVVTIPQGGTGNGEDTP
ncbi:2Fe-2S iron-sulfur cluster binding domain-containing protein [Glycomyces paridis]|uniref:2Fe-2S iron-sulfur cluster binding domain-containing protein n=1 Tax=Glycomyces paridis TaxID=2126555 RepID=A0A4S8PN20_9ACTN|nr:2Fe-2S iron-sulfur cluster-binding protein [Glycomyces paridis]THV32240.1 2Fe-2S iron-sulfur cluster binding domain-containing protein [Glycomyces paridis]